MQCSCGGSTKTRTEVKGGEIITEYERCITCGRVCITWQASKQEQKPLLDEPDE